ncbi:hypothetical protein BJV78DRAFT_1157258 [Lactifluus subvellereus]|nr:hypothetical protein BJV78DRAFT_1157258 [Lactifluus subvellereus]
MMGSAGDEVLGGPTGGMDDGGWFDDNMGGPLDTELQLSGEGGETEHLSQYLGHLRSHTTSQTWSMRSIQLQSRWDEQLPSLIEAYLDFKLHECDNQPVYTRLNTGDTTDQFQLLYIDVYDFSYDHTFLQLPGCIYPNVNLLRQGCLSSSPTQVSFAISLRTLELYRWLCIHQPCLSIQAWVCSICDYHNMTYHRSYWQQFSDMFDVYLKIKCGVEDHINQVLDRTAPNWRIKHSCPCCQNELPGETPLEVSVIGVLDGNQSLKCVHQREGTNTDPRQFSSDYYISEGLVDRFKHDVKPRPMWSLKKPVNSGVDYAEESPVWSKDGQEAMPADGDEDQTPCTEQWKATQNDNVKRMHGLVWWICDMVSSGELAKYPLALVNQVLEVFQDRPGLGYNIGCSFTETIAKSSIVEKARGKALCLVFLHFTAMHTNAFVSCLTILSTGGFGIEDLETAERIFASFNGLANITRYASPAFLYGNYKQVGQILQEAPIVIAALQSGQALEDTAYHQHLNAERMESGGTLSFNAAYQKALSKLEGYKLRIHINKALKTRARLYRQHFLGLILKSTGILHHLKLEHAEEERRCLNVEISCLRLPASSCVAFAKTTSTERLSKNICITMLFGHCDPTVEFWGITSERPAQKMDSEVAA